MGRGNALLKKYSAELERVFETQGCYRPLEMRATGLHVIQEEVGKWLTLIPCGEMKFFRTLERRGIWRDRKVSLVVENRLEVYLKFLTKRKEKLRWNI